MGNKPEKQNADALRVSADSKPLDNTVIIDDYYSGVDYEHFLKASRAMTANFDYVLHADELFEDYFKNEYQKSRKDEFDYPSKRNAAISKIKARDNDFDPGHLHNLYVNWEIGQYDFEREAFPITTIRGTTTHRFLSKRFRLSTDLFPKSFKLKLDGNEITGALEMP